VVDYYRLAYNLHSLAKPRQVMETSLTKTLAAKLQRSVQQVYRRFHATIEVNGKSYQGLQVVIERPGKQPLVAQWGGIPLRWDIGATGADLVPPVWVDRSELEKRLLANVCEYCGATGHTDPTHRQPMRRLPMSTARTG